MSVYDSAYKLKDELIESAEVKDYKASWEKIKQNPQNKKMIDDFRMKQIEIQAMQLSGEEPDKEKLEQIEKLYSVISLNPEINNFLQCEYRFGVLMNDITKIISEAIDIDME